MRMKTVGTIIDYGLYRLIMFVLDLRNNRRFEKTYGDFRLRDNYDPLTVKKLHSESGIILGCISQFIREIETPVDSLLLPGENNEIKRVYQDRFKIPRARTAGILDDVDFRWNFEEDPPPMGQYQLIVSQAILEHLINPYKHLSDLHRLLEPGGHLIVHSVLPGYFYHRYPLDCLRFYPEWFEEVANRLGFHVAARHIHRGHIFYRMKK